METGKRVGWGRDVPVTDVQVARRVRVHRQEIEIPPGLVVEVDLVQAQLLPAPLPARLDLGRVVALDSCPTGWFGCRPGCGLGPVRHVGPVGCAWLTADSKRPPAAGEGSFDGRRCGRV